MASGVDVSGRAKALADLEQSRARFRSLAENIPQLAWMSDANGVTHWFNERWFEYTGAAPGWGQHADRARAMQAGFDHHFTKPADPQALDAIVRGEDSAGLEAVAAGG